MPDIEIIRVIEQGPQGVPGAVSPAFQALATQVTTDRAAVAVDRAVVSVDRNLVAVDRTAVANDRALTQAGAVTASQALGLIADSTTSLAIAAGDKAFTIPTGKAFAPGHPVRASSKANPDTQAMIGVVKSYSGSTLVVNVSSVVGSATRADWTVAVTGGALAPIGATQDAQAIVQMSRLERSLAAAGVPDEPSLVLDFIRGVHFASQTAIAAGIMALIAAMPGSSFARNSTATYFDSDGLLKTAAANVPRIEYDPITRVCRGFLTEGSATNLIIRSEEFDNASWSKVRATVSANAAISPDGTMTADKIVEDNSASTSHFARATATIIAGAVSTGSIFLKAAERGFAHISLLNPAAPFEAARVMVNLTTGATGALDQANGATGGSLLVTNVGNGWWRVCVTGVLGSATSIRLDVFTAINTTVSGNYYTGDGTSGIYAWGAQIEAGSGATSYIPTSASAGVRAVDLLRINGAPWYTDVGLTLFAEFSHLSIPAVSSIPVYLGPSAGVFGSGFYLTRSASGLAVAPAVAPIDLNISITDSTTLLNRLALRFKLNDAALAHNGSLAGTDTVCAPPTGPITLTVGSGFWSGVANAPFNGHIRRIVAFAPLANAKLQALSNLTTWS